MSQEFTDAAVRNEASSIIEGLFRNIGRANQDAGAANQLGGLGVQLAEFIAMPGDLAVLFMDMSVDLTKMILESLEQAGIILVRGLSPM